MGLSSLILPLFLSPSASHIGFGLGFRGTLRYIPHALSVNSDPLKHHLKIIELNPMSLVRTRDRQGQCEDA